MRGNQQQFSRFTPFSGDSSYLAVSPGSGTFLQQPMANAPPVGHNDTDVSLIDLQAPEYDDGRPPPYVPPDTASLNTQLLKSEDS